MTDQTDELLQIWVYLRESPLMWLSVTVIAYTGAWTLFRKMNNFPLLNPVLLSVGVIVALLMLTDTAYGRYFEGAQFVHFMLGPVTVALAVPLYRNIAKVRSAMLPMLVALAGGGVAAAASAVLLGEWLGGSGEIARSLAPKSVTTPIAMAISETIGGLPSLTAVMVILTGILGGVIGVPLMRFFRIRDERAQGFGLGLACHGIGTARAFQQSGLSGTFAAVGMGSNGVFTAIMMPLLADLLW